MATARRAPYPRGYLNPPCPAPIESVMDPIAGVQARIQEIISQFEGPPVSPTASTTDASTIGIGNGGIGNGGIGSGGTDFASALAQATGTAAPMPGAGVVTATGTLNRAGVDPVQWAKDFLTKLGAPITAENVRAISAWEQAEGTKASYNPLATTQSGYAGETRFNSVGVKNYADYQDGLDANVRAITNGRYANILSALAQGNDAMSVARAIADSPWGTGTGVERVLGGA